MGMFGSSELACQSRRRCCEPWPRHHFIETDGGWCPSLRMEVDVAKQPTRKNILASLNWRPAFVLRHASATYIHRVGY